MEFQFQIDSRQVEALCRWQRSARPKALEAPPISSPLRAVPVSAAPCLNYDDVPEAGFGRKPKFSGRRASGGRQKHQPSRFCTVFEENNEHEDWPQVENPAWHESQPEQSAQWPCAFCTFLNADALTVCEMCDRPRVSPVPDNVAHEPAIHESAYLEPSSVSHSQFDRIPGCPCKWPSLLQAAEKSWDICDQSSMASSLVDVARLADLDGVHEDSSMSDVEVVSATEGTAVECFDIFSETGSQIGGGHGYDASSVAYSWWNLVACGDADKDQTHCDKASVASSWLDLGNVADVDAKAHENVDACCVETCSMPSWLEVAEPTALALTSVGSFDAAGSENATGSSYRSDRDDSSVASWIDAVSPAGFHDANASVGQGVAAGATDVPVPTQSDGHGLGSRPKATSWSAVVSAGSLGGTIVTPDRSGVAMPPLVRRQAPHKKQAAHSKLDAEILEYQDDRDGRGRDRADRQYRRRR